MLNPHWQYLKYVVRHKWFVLLAGWQLGVPWWRLLLHDWTKFLPREWFPYVAYFYGKAAKDYMHDPAQAGREFNTAWNHHQKKNDHHWQFWIITMDVGDTFCLPMSKAARLEMLADWIGAGKAQGSKPVWEWYTQNKGKIKLHDETRAWLEAQLEAIKAA